MEEVKQQMDSEKLIQHLNERWKNHPCPMCSANSWSLSDKIFELREFHGGNLVLGSGPIYPIIPVTCRNCGNTVLINAILSGIIEKPSENIKTERP